jgi:hypothetical protein
VTSKVEAKSARLPQLLVSWRFFDDGCELERGLTGRARGSLEVRGFADARLNLRRQAMKTIVSSLIALSVLAGIASVPASAFDAKTFFEQQDRSRYWLQIGNVAAGRIGAAPSEARGISRASLA